MNTDRVAQLRAELRSELRAQRTKKLKDAGDDAVVTISQLATLTGIPRSSLYKMVHLEGFPVLDIPCTSWRVRVGDFHAWVRGLRPTASDKGWTSKARVR